MRRIQMSTEATRDSVGTSGDGQSVVGDGHREPSSGPQRTKARRAVQACSNCRKHKLRCLGGWPCNRCEKQKITCDFDRPGHPAAAKATETIERLEQLEASVTSILASMSSSLAADQSIHTPRQHSVVSDIGSYQPPAIQNNGFHSQAGDIHQPTGYPFRVDALASPFPGPVAGPSFSPHSPPREYASLLGSGPQLPGPPEQPHSGLDPEFLSVPTQDLDPPGPAVTSTSITTVPAQTSPPTININHTVTSPATHTASPTASSLASRPSRRTEPPPSGESRLRAVADPYSAPFKGVLHQPSVWNNSEQSRRPSLEPAEEDGQVGEGTISAVEADVVDKSDPIGAEIVTREVAIWLFDFFATRCHPFIPVVDFSQRDAYDAIRHKSPFLFSTILAIAARFTSPSDPPLQTNPAQLANLAESHLSQTLLRKQHSLPDVQATLLLAGWGLQSGGGGPDAWLLTGHAWRMGRRLGLWRPPKPSAIANFSEVENGDGANRERHNGYMQRWRTWMCLFAFDRCLSLGFGRPASQFENGSVDTEGFVKECVARASLPSSSPLGSSSTGVPLNGTGPTVGLASTPTVSMSTGDFFIASQVELMLIGRDLCAWLEAVRDRGSPSWSWDMVKEMNERLDKWSKDWTWSSSPYLPYLNSSTRIARMYCEHVRLCLNSLALRATSTPAEAEGEVVSRYLEKALNSATAIIQMHHDAATTDGGLSYCIDYLTIVLATAAVFLIRLVRAHTQTKLLDSGVAVHYLKMAVGALEKSEKSQTRLSTHLAKTIKEMARAAGFGDAFPHGENSPQRDPDEAHDVHVFPTTDEFGQIPLDSTFEALLAFQNQVDPSSYLGFLFGSEEAGVGSVWT